MLSDISLAFDIVQRAMQFLKINLNQFTKNDEYNWTFIQHMVFSTDHAIGCHYLSMP